MFKFDIEKIKLVHNTNMSMFRNVFVKLFPKRQRLLGRWEMNYTKEQLDRKIYYANHDHCGPCGDTLTDPIDSSMRLSANINRFGGK